jgi:CBS domain-containing protein
MQVSEVMTRGVECVQPDDSLQGAAEAMSQLNVGVLPVCENDRLLGTITDRDITIRATAEGVDPTVARVRDAMTRKLFFCFDDQDVVEAANLMKEKQVRRLIVVNRANRLVGIVSLGDLATETGDSHLAGSTLEGVSDPKRPIRR